MIDFGNSWNEILDGEFDKSYYQKLRAFLKEEYSTRTIYPNMHDIFNSLKTTDYNNVSVLILGQDPYHGPNQGHGLSFSVRPGVQTPPSLQNIYKELQNDLGCYIPNNGYLMPWAKQGVLLMNAVLTVRGGQANSHQGMGWEIFTDTVIAKLNQREKPVIFLLWGKYAQSKTEIITGNHHFILKAPHPSPFSAARGFFGCKHFSKTNEILQSLGSAPIDWQIKNI